MLDVGLDNAVARRRVRPPDEPVAVGDWVTLDTVDPDRIGDLAERTTVLQRGAVGAEGRERLIASTLDVVFVVSAFVTTEKLERRSLNPRRMERCVTAVREGSGTPVAVLNKADLPRHDSEELGDVRRELSARLGVNVVCVSAETRLGLDELRQHLTPDDTVAFVGPSGVGKSSLINVLLDQPALDVDHVRQTDAKGRHTTSHRELLMIPGEHSWWIHPACVSSLYSPRRVKPPASTTSRRWRAPVASPTAPMRRSLAARLWQRPNVASCSPTASRVSTRCNGMPAGSKPNTALW